MVPGIRGVSGYLREFLGLRECLDEFLSNYWESRYIRQAEMLCSSGLAYDDAGGLVSVTAQLPQ